MAQKNNIIDRGQRRHRWLTIDDYVNRYLDGCVDVIREREAVDSINLIGVCQGGVLSLCHAALHPEKVRNLVLTVTPIDFHADKTAPDAAGGYMNRWARAACRGHRRARRFGGQRFRAIGRPQLSDDEPGGQSVEVHDRHTPLTASTA